LVPHIISTGEGPWFSSKVPKKKQPIDVPNGYPQAASTLPFRRPVLGARWFPSSESRSVGAHITPISLWFIVDMVYKNWVNNCTYYNYTIYGL
jgi:hypothetical protein